MIRQVLRQDETWISVDPVVGCKLNCQYCFLQTYDETPKMSTAIISPEETLDRLVKFQTYRSDSVVMLGSETDFFMDQCNISYLTRLLQLYDEKRIGNVVVLMTKCHIPDEFVKLVQGLQNTKVVFYLSYSGLPHEIEPAVNVHNLRANFERLSAANLEIVHYWRPLIPQNSSPKVMQEVLDFVSQYAKCSRVTGLKLNPEIKRRLWFWKELKDASIDLRQIGVVWTQQAVDFLEVAKVQSYPDYPLFYTNSCALAYILGVPDFNGFYDSSVCQSNHCPVTQRAICKAAQEGYVPDRKRVEIELKKIGLTGEAVIDQRQRAVMVKEPVEHGILVYLTQVLKYRVISPDIRSDHEWGGLVIGRESLIFP